MAKLMQMVGLMPGISLWFALSGLPAPAQQFSADLVRTDAGAVAARAFGTVNVSNRKVRLEIADVPAGFFVLLGDADAAYFVRPAQQMFMEARQSSPLTQLFVVVDPDDPCKQWQAMSKIAGAADRGAEWRCERIGDDIVDGRRTVRYAGISPHRQRYTGWIDPRLNFLLRVRTEDGAVVDVVNIREAPQPETLFEVPAGYRKFDPQQLIDRIKQSDVWVEPPQ